MTGKAHANIDSYREPYQRDGKHYNYYIVKTGNIFTTKGTFSLETARAWKSQGETVLVTNEHSGKVYRTL